MQQEMKKFTTIQLLNFCLGFFGLQFAWQMRIILSGPVTESLGASPFLFGIIWLAGPVTGIVVQPIIGALSDRTQTPIGRRVPYLIGGALLAAIGLVILPNSGNIASVFEGAPVWLGLLIAAIMIWVIDACVNAAQGPYRALIPDNMPKEQHAVANSFLSFAIGLGSVIAAGTAPFLKHVFNYQMSNAAQFYMAAIAFLLAMIWTCITIKERKIAPVEKTEKNASFMETLKEFFAMSGEVSKICTVQFFAWIGLMSMMIFFTQYSVHTIYQVPDLAGADSLIKTAYENLNAEGTNFSSICFAIFNLVCFIVAIPIGKLADKFGNKYVHIVSLVSMALAYFVMAFTTDKVLVACAMGLAGIGWSSTLALPFAMLSKYIKPGTEGSIMGVFNIFIAAPQVLVCTILAKFIDMSKITLEGGLSNNHWEYAFIVGAVMLLLSAFTTALIKEKD
ncbi:MAG: MFS transporter [Candidatus Gastranaerophilales bacterium]|nr:MFS transporter [Candidatus Gastranaerophilales bacterium]